MTAQGHERSATAHPVDAVDRVDPVDAVDTVLCDLDGVVWLAHRPIEGAADAVARLRAGGRRVLFVTNNSMATIAEQEAALEAIGIPAADDVLTSGQAAATLLTAGERVHVCGGPGVVEAVTAVGALVPVEPPTVDTVVVGLHRDFDYERLRRAAAFVHRGARLVGTNDDATFPTPDGPIPGGGSLLAAVATAAGVTPVVAGKPHAPMVELVRRRLGDRFDPARMVMVGDRPSTDGEFAVRLGCRFALVRTGVTRPDAAVEVERWRDLPDLATVADAIIGGDGEG
jgi:4-nitrophenyl phosphatase